MKITKLGHCCLLIETKGQRILTDPGSYTIEAHSKLTNLNYILFTHEHADHYHLESLLILIKSNPQVVVYSNFSVGQLLAQAGVKHLVVNNNGQIFLGEVPVVGI